MVGFWIAAVFSVSHNAAALQIPDQGRGVAVGADATRGVDEDLVVGVGVAGERRQFERAAVLDRAVDQLVVEERNDVVAEHGVPFCSQRRPGPSCSRPRPQFFWPLSMR